MAAPPPLLAHDPPPYYDRWLDPLQIGSEFCIYSRVSTRQKDEKCENNSKLIRVSQLFRTDVSPCNDESLTMLFSDFFLSIKFALYNHVKYAFCK